MKSISELQDIASQVRRDIIRMTSQAQSGHPGGSLGCADFLTTLYFNTMNVNPDHFTMNGEGEDVFFLSNGHISPVLYSVLARRGYFPTSELGTFRKLDSRLQGHPSITHNLPGVRMASGSLGQGLSNAVGAALTKKLNGDNSLVYCLCGDGELQEGQNWEAIMFASAKNVNNLIAVVDFNGLQIDGATKDVCDLGDLRAKFEAFGWQVLNMDGHNIENIISVLNEAKQKLANKKPVFIVMKTEMGHGVDFMTNDCKYHGSVTNAEQTKIALSQLKETLGDF
ncbi:MAG: transketolase [Bacteroidales bacterium]|jgi:transketolase|nr:transketolase [Bacteroidales bacterium]